MNRFSAIILLAALGCASADPAPDPATLDDVARAAIADTVRRESDRMLEVMRTRDAALVLAFYGKNAAYVGNGAIGDWAAIVTGTPGRYAHYTKVECRWQEPLRIDVLSRQSAVVTAVLDCDKADDTGRSWREIVARTEVLAPENGRWKIVAVHESNAPESEPLR